MPCFGHIHQHHRAGLGRSHHGVIRDLRHLLPARDVLVALFFNAADDALAAGIGQRSGGKVAAPGFLGSQVQRHHLGHRRLRISAVGKRETSREEQHAAAALVGEIADQILLFAA